MLALVAHAVIPVALEEGGSLVVLPAKSIGSVRLLAALAEGSDVLTKISTNSSVITLINVFTVEPANQ